MVSAPPVFLNIRIILCIFSSTCFSVRKVLDLSEYLQLNQTQKNPSPPVYPLQVWSFQPVPLWANLRTKLPGIPHPAFVIWCEYDKYDTVVPCLLWGFGAMLYAFRNWFWFVFRPIVLLDNLDVDKFKVFKVKLKNWSYTSYICVMH